MALRIFDVVCLILSHLDEAELDNVRSVNKLFYKAFLEYRVYKKITYHNKKIVLSIPEWFNSNTTLDNCIISMDLISYLPDGMTLLQCRYNIDSVYSNHFRQQSCDRVLLEYIHPVLHRISQIVHLDRISYITLTKENIERLRLCRCNEKEICEDISSCHNFCRCIPSYLPLLRRQYFFEQYDNIDINTILSHHMIPEICDRNILGNISDSLSRVLISIYSMISSGVVSEHIIDILKHILEEVRNNNVINITERSINILIDYISDELEG